MELNSVLFTLTERVAVLPLPPPVPPPLVPPDPCPLPSLPPAEPVGALGEPPLLRWGE